MSRTGPPTFSIVTPVYNPPIDVLRDTIASVYRQTCTDWEWILVDDCSTDPDVVELLRHHASADSRITLIERAGNGHIVAASNDGVAASTGDFIALLDHDDQLVPHALAAMAARIDRFDDVDYLYSDEDKLAANGRCFGSFRKPSWSPERLRGQNYCSHFSVVRASLVKELGGFRPGFEGSQDHDLVLRIGEVARRVVHVPEVLYHWRIVPGSAAGGPDAKPYALVAGESAVQSHLDRLGIDAVVTRDLESLSFRVDRRLPAAASVSVVIALGRRDWSIHGVRRGLVDAMRGLVERAGHDHVEFVVVHHVSVPAAVLAELGEVVGDPLRLVPVLRLDTPGDNLNVGVLAAAGDNIVILDEVVAATTVGWVPALVAPLAEPDVGMTGARVCGRSGTVHSAGYTFAGGDYRHLCQGAERGDPGFLAMMRINREVSGVSTACAAIRREVFLEAGGFCVELAQLRDVDLSYKVRHLGYRIVALADVTVDQGPLHPPSPSDLTEPVKFLRHRWGTPKQDPFNPDTNVLRERLRFALAR